MKELHALVDFENVQPTIDELAKLAPGFTDVWLFHGPHQAKQAQQFSAAHSGVTLVPRSGNGPNALDFHLSFYLGYVAAKHPKAHLVVVANDKGYDPMIAHARMLDFTVKRVGHKAKSTSVAQVAQPVVKKLTPAAKVAPVKNAASAKVAKPAKKTPVKVPTAKQPAEKPVAAKKAATKQPTAKKTPAKKASVKKPAIPKSAAKAALTPTAKAPKAVTPATVVVAPDAKEFSRIKAGLIKMGNKAPHKLKSFLRHIGAQLGKSSTAEQIDAMVEKLERAKVVHIAGDVVLYS
jgi:hypothetical protein